MAETKLLDLNDIADKVVVLALPKLLQRYYDHEALSVLQSIVDEVYCGGMVYISEENAFKIQRLIDEIKGE